MRDDSAIRLLVADLLRQARAAHRRMQSGNDATALHDFRVALRRLRSTERAYRRQLREVIPKSVRNELREIARSSGRTRDVEVQLEWLAAQKSSSGDVRFACQWLVEKLKAEQSRINADESATFGDFPALAASIARLLRKTAGDGATQSSDGEAFAGVAARRLRSSSRVLRELLDAVTGIGAQEELHQARIEGKRLRYILEPVVATDEHSEDNPLIERLKGLQDSVGGLRDLQLLRVRIESYLESGNEELTQSLRKGLAALVVRLSNAEQKAWRTYRSRWTGRSRKTFFSELQALVSQLQSRGLLLESDAEIERKYLLRSLPARARRVNAQEIDQGWIPGAKFAERLRRVRSANGRVQYFRTVKLGSGVARVELEERTTASIFNTMWPLTVGKRVVKKRYRIREAGFVWEIDEFSDRVLYLAEIELPHVDTRVELPGWLRRYVVREVTNEPRYVNRNLAR